MVDNFENSWPNRNFGWQPNFMTCLPTYRTIYLVLHNLQADADFKPWSTIITNNLVNHGLRKLCQTMVNHSWLRYCVTNQWFTMVDHGFDKALPNHGQPWLTEMLFHKPMVDPGWPWFGKALSNNHGWLRCHFTNLRLTIVDHALRHPWLTMVCDVYAVT